MGQHFAFDAACFTNSEQTEERGGTTMTSINCKRRPGRLTTRLVQPQAILNTQLPVRGASEFSHRGAVLAGEERDGAFVKRRLGVCTGLLWGCTTQGVG